MNLNRKNLAGLFCCLAIMAVGFSAHGNVALYFNLAGLLIVVGGTAGATLLSYPIARLKIVIAVLLRSYRTPLKRPEDIVEILVDLSVKSRLNGQLSLQEDEAETSIYFLRRALGFLVDGIPVQHIRESLGTEMYFFRLRREESERILLSISHLLPSFGLAGSVVGLIGMLGGVGDTVTILATVPVALTSTLYGVVLSSFFFVPFANLVRERTEQELVLQKIIVEGIIAIENEVDPRILERRLQSFLTPSARQVKLVSLERIRERFQINLRAVDFQPQEAVVPVRPAVERPSSPQPR